MFVFLFGLGKGKIELTLEKFNFSPGDTIKGRIVLSMNKPTKARGIKARLWGERTITRTSYYNSGPRTEKRNQIIFNFELPLDGEKEYSSGEYEFEIKVPNNILQSQQAPDGVIGELAKAAAFLGGSFASQPRWYLEAKLDIPGGMDVSKRVQINIG
ncbi:MAG: hypothetical protein QXK06_00930 [Candidatus Diapherotrites archaeon]